MLISTYITSRSTYYLIFLTYYIMNNNICFFCKLSYDCNYYNHVMNNIYHNQNVRNYYKQLINSNFSKNNKLDNKK